MDKTPGHSAERKADKRIKKTRKQPQDRCVLLVEREPSMQGLIEQCPAEHGKVRVIYADTLSAAREQVEAQDAIDLVVVDTDLSDGCGLDLADELADAETTTQTVVVSSSPDFEAAQRAMRAGVCDYLIRQTAPDAAPIEQDKLTKSVRAALARQWVERERSKRVKRLKKLCKRLDAARQEISDQVDVLCSDLVLAYQELAVQMQSAINVSGFQAVIGEELDLEIVLRKTLEHLISKAGACNAAIFLPSSMDEYSLGGYVNYDCTKESADMLLQHMADVLAPRAAAHAEVCHLTDNTMLEAFLGDDWNYLADSHLLCFPCLDEEGEPLAVVALFRDGGQPFNAEMPELCGTLGDMLGESLAKIIHIHHRAMPEGDFGEEGDGEDWLPSEPWDGYNEQADPFGSDEDEDLPF